MPASDDRSPAPDADEPQTPACVLVFNGVDPSGASGLAADVLAIGSIGAHPLPVVTGAWVGDTSGPIDFHPFDEDVVGEQARAVLEDVSVQIIKVGFAGRPETLATIAGIAADYAEIPVVVYLPDLSWWDSSRIEDYLEALADLLLPQASVLAGNHSTLSRWLLPDWDGSRPPSARDLAKAASAHGVPYTLVTGIALPEQHIDNAIATPNAVLASERFERFDAVFAGAGDTLSAALAALLATDGELSESTREALRYLDQSLDAGFQPGMGRAIPDRLFWARAEPDADSDDASSSDDIQTHERPH